MVRDKQFYKMLLKIALPVALQSLIALSVNMLDNIMVGSLGDLKLSGVALANQVTAFISFFIRGISGGAAVLISQYWGKRDMDKIKTIFAMIFRICTGITFVVSMLIFIFPSQVMFLFTDKADIVAQSVIYIRIISFTYIMFSISDTLLAMLRCIEIVKIALVISVTTLFTNLFFNYMLIFGKFGAPALGIRGAAWATFIARAIELVIVIVYVLFVDKKLSMRVKDLLRHDRLLFKDFMKYGAPIVAGDLQWGLVGTCKSSIIGHLGATMIAANSITDVVLNLGSIFTNGLASAACVVIGKSIGESNGDYTKTRKYSSTIQILFLFVGVFMMSLIFFGRSIPISFYNVSAEVKELASLMLAIGAVTMLGTTYHAACFTGINRGGGDSKFVFRVDMICGWLVVLPLAYLAAFVIKWPNELVHLSMVFLMTRIDQCFKWLIAFIRLRGTKWIRTVTRS